MFPVVSKRWKVSLKKRTVWDNLDSDSDYEPSGEKEEEEEEVGEGEGVGQEEKVNWTTNLHYHWVTICFIHLPYNR